MQSYCIEELDGFFGYYNTSHIDEFCRFSGGLLASASEAQFFKETHTIYKLHLSLHADDYQIYKDELTPILLQFLVGDVFKTFKTTNPAQIKDHINERWGSNCDQLIAIADALTDAKRFRKFVSNSGNRNNVENLFGSSVYGQIIASEDYQTFKKSVEDLLTNQRFLTGDQVTIYVPKNVDIVELKVMMVTLQQFFESHKIRPGTVAEIASPITDYINFRQEYSNLDHERVDRIDAIGNSSDVVQLLKSQQESSDLFKELSVRPTPKKSCFNAFLNLFSCCRAKEDKFVLDIRNEV